MKSVLRKTAVHPTNGEKKAPPFPGAFRGCASETFLPLVYDELRRLAASKMSGNSSSQTLQPTALVHEAWLRLRQHPGDWNDKAHFFAAAARAMRWILVDRARMHATGKRNTLGKVSGESLEQFPAETPGERVLAIHESLERLEQEDPQAAEIVLLKFFSGLETREIAKVTRSSTRSVERKWALAKARLFQMIRQAEEIDARP